MRLLICAGGTGGGIYPALSVLQRNSSDEHRNNDTLTATRSVSSPEPISFETLWIGGQGGIEEQLVGHAGVHFTAIPAAGIHGVGLKALPGNLWKLFRGFLAALKIIRRFQPDVAFFTGGYITVPVALAATLLRIPSLLFVPDIEPGMALKFVSRFASAIAFSTDASMRYFTSESDSSRHHEDRLFVTGYPTRPDMEKWERASACASLGLREDLPIIMVFGGSKGARSINRALLNILPQLLLQAQVIHISGQLDWQEVDDFKSNLSEELAPNYHPYPYLHEEMGAALSSAQLVISRSGAAVLGEYPLMGIPAILIPYPYAWRYQHTNASYLASKNAALILKDEELSSRLLSAIQQLLDHPETLENMRESMKKLYVSGAAYRLQVLLKELGTHHIVSDIKKGSLWSS